MTVVSSDAAIAKINVPISLLQSDPTLNLILSVAPYHQTTIQLDKKPSNPPLTLSTKSSSSFTELTQRNAILRHICGMIFHNALDKYPYYLLGGHSASGAGGSPESALCLASISSYMSIASSIRAGDSDVELDEICRHLNQVLEHNSFLVGSTPKPTLGDLDVFFALTEVSNATGITSFNADDSLVHLKRWMVAVAADVEEMVASSSAKKRANWPVLNVPVLNFGIVEPSPTFYYGDEEDIDDVPTAATSTAVAATATQATSNNKNNKDIATNANNNNNNSSGGAKELSEEEKKAAAEKRAKKNAEKAKKKQADAPPPSAASVPSDDVNASAFDIRVGKIIEVWEHEESDKLWCEKVDLGEAEPRQILSGLRKFYNKEEMQDRMVLVLCNLKKRNLVGVPSHGMVLCASNADHTDVEFVIPPEGAKVGERVVFEGFDGEAENENKFAKKKMLEKLAPDLKTDGDGVVVWRGAKSVTSAGPCVASKGMKGAHVS